MGVFLKWISETYFFFNEIAIYLLFGLLVAGIVHIFFPESLVRKHLGKGSFSSVIKATLFGIPIPLCSCGVVPVAKSLQKSGASKGAIVSFLIATPQIGTDSFLVTYSLLGWLFAVMRIVASFFTALISGFWINLIDRKGKTTTSQNVEDNIQTSILDRLRSILGYVEFELLGSIAKPLVIGIFIAGLISAFIPETIFETYLGHPLLSMLLMMAIGIPLYVCASASTPIAASLLLKGISPGAALVFLLTGPATNAVNITTVSQIIGKKFTVLYLFVVALVSLLLGFLLNWVSPELQLHNHLHHHEILPDWMHFTGMLLLGGMLLFYFIQSFKRKSESMSQKNMIDVKGMTCQHCAANVKNAASSVNGVTNVVVNLETGKVGFDAESESSINVVKDKIRQAGYDV